MGGLTRILFSLLADAASLSLNYRRRNDLRLLRCSNMATTPTDMANIGSAAPIPGPPHITKCAFRLVLSRSNPGVAPVSGQVRYSSRAPRSGRPVTWIPDFACSCAALQRTEGQRNDRRTPLRLCSVVVSDQKRTHRTFSGDFFLIPGLCSRDGDEWRQRLNRRRL